MGLISCLRGSDDDGFAVFGDECTGSCISFRVISAGCLHAALLAGRVLNGQDNFHPTILA